MKISSIFTLAVVFALNLQLSAPARAVDVRYPEKGDPALTFTMPDDWTTSPFQAQSLKNSTLQVRSRGKYGLSINLIELSPEMIHELDTAKDPMLMFATEAFEASKSVITGKSREELIGGIKGISYLANHDMGNGTTMAFRLIFLRLDNTHLVSIGVIGASPMPPADQALVDKVLASMKFTKAAAPAQ